MLCVSRRTWAIPSGQGLGVTIQCLFCRPGLFTAACIGQLPRDEEDLEGELAYEKVAWLAVWPMNRLMIDRDAVVNLHYCRRNARVTSVRWREADFTQDEELRHFVPSAHSPPPEREEQLHSCQSLGTAETGGG
jgi:hypothetical protein